MTKSGIKAFLILSFLGTMSACGGQKEGVMPQNETIEEVEFVKGVVEKDDKEASSIYDERYGTPIDDKEGKPKDDLVKDPNEDEILPFGDGADIEYDNIGDYSSDY